MEPFLEMGGAGWVGVDFQEISMGYPWKFDRVNSWTSIAQTTAVLTLLAR